MVFSVARVILFARNVRFSGWFCRRAIIFFLLIIIFVCGSFNNLSSEKFIRLTFVVINFCGIGFFGKSYWLRSISELLFKLVITGIFSFLSSVISFVLFIVLVNF